MQTFDLTRRFAPYRIGALLYAKGTRTRFRQLLKTSLLAALVYAGGAEARFTMFNFLPWSTPNWTYHSGASTTTAGSVLASKVYSSAYSLMTDGTEYINFSGEFTVTGGLTYHQTYRAMNLNYLPGTALRIIWLNETNGCTGTGMPNLPMNNQVLGAKTVTTYIAGYYYFCAQIVLVDPAAYTGKASGNANEVGFRSRASDLKGSYPPHDWATVYPLNGLVAGSLPQPAPPTCTAIIGGTSRTINLPSIRAGAIPADGSARSEGAAAEVKFQVGVESCKKDAHYSIYFVDKQQTANNTTTLRQSAASPSADKVGLRLYNGASATSPIRFGTNFSGTRVDLGTAPADNASLSVDLYAQYVRLPNVTGNQIKAGDFSAAATLQFAYD